MAISEETFYNLLGEEINRTNLVNEMINFYKLKLQAGETKITDFNEGSEIRNLLETIAVNHYQIMENENELTQIGFIATSYGEWLDLHGQNPFINLPREEGEEATGYVTFSIPEAASTEITLPDSTIIVSTETGLEYATDSTGIIGVGETSCTVPVTCLTVGMDGNVPVGDLITIDDDYIDINGLTVTNTEPITGGLDYEEDEEYSARLLSYVRQDDFGSQSYYQRLAGEINGVHDIVLVNYTGYTKQVLVNGDVKPTPDTVLAEVTEAFTEPENIVIGHTFKIDKPSYYTLDLEVDAVVSNVYEDDVIEDTIRAYIDGGNYEMLEFDGFYIGDDLLVSKLTDTLLLLDDIESVTFSSDSTPLEDIVIPANTVLKIGTITITQTQSGETS